MLLSRLLPLLISFFELLVPCFHQVFIYGGGELFDVSQHGGSATLSISTRDHVGLQLSYTEIIGGVGFITSGDAVFE